MADSPAAPPPHTPPAARLLGSARLVTLVVLLALLVLCFVLFWTTRATLGRHSSFNSNVSGSHAESQLVDLSPWKTVLDLVPLAKSTEEYEIAREAEHLADHLVDQAFAAALRQAGLDARNRTLAGDAHALQQKIVTLEQLRRRDQALVDKLSAMNPPSKAGVDSDESDELQVAKAQLGLDTDELADAQRNLDRASGNDSLRIHDELAAHEQSMLAYDTQVSSGQIAVISVAQNRTLASRIQAWLNQIQREDLIEQARSQGLDDANAITAQRNALQAKANAAAAPGQSTQLANLTDRSTEREILSIDDDRIQTEQQLASVYANWSAQLKRQHRIALHLILSSLLVILLILAAMLLSDLFVRRLMARPSFNRWQMNTLRSVLDVGVQAVGFVVILLVIFGVPSQTPTILGLATAALTIALQDYILAFLGWFALMGKNGIHVGDWVEINSVSGKVVEFTLMTTTLLETGHLANPGHFTGRRITLMNGYAIRGQFFNFSSAGQWMWDEIVLSVPAAVDIHALARQIETLATDETLEGVRCAEEEWQQSARSDNPERYSAAPVVNLRPSGDGIDLQLRYVTSAADRFELRNRLYHRAIEILHHSDAPPQPGEETQKSI